MGLNQPIMVLVANKIDLTDLRLVSKEMGEELATKLGASYYETSAKTGDGVQTLFSELAIAVSPKQPRKS